MDVHDLGSEYRVVVDMPGVEPRQIEVGPGPVRGTISIGAGATAATPAEGRPILVERTARTAASRTRVVPVAWDADAEQATHTLQNGVLTLRIPKNAQPAAPRDERAFGSTPR